MANKVVESYRETTPPVEGMSKSPEVTEDHSYWHTMFMMYLRTEGMPDDKDEHERLRRRVGHYVLVNGEILRRSPNDTLM
jgi:hypothetical protein